MAEQMTLEQVREWHRTQASYYVTHDRRAAAGHYAMADALDAAIAERDALKLQAKIHAQDARTANATIAEIYQLCSGGKGEPGNWHGAEPVREVIAERDALRLRFDLAPVALVSALGELSFHAPPRLHGKRVRLVVEDQA